MDTEQSGDIGVKFDLFRISFDNHDFDFFY